ncbi:MAG: ATP-binding cassette domain-containing protein [bacterium]
MIIELKDIHFSYPTLGAESGDSHYALAGVSLRISGNETVAIVGASGSGKTTLIQLLNGLLEPTRGQVSLDGETTSYRGDFALSWRRRVGLVFQFPEIQFFENSVFDEIAFALRNIGVDEVEIQKLVTSVLKELEMDDMRLAQQSPFRLSEGQKRRIAIASVLIMDPEVFILDEPTSALDYNGVQVIRSIVKRFQADKRTAIIASHDMDFVHSVAQRIICLADGKIIYDGPQRQFFELKDLLTQAHLDLPRVLKIERALKERGQLKAMTKIPHPMD